MDDARFLNAPVVFDQVLIASEGLVFVKASKEPRELEVIWE